MHLLASLQQSLAALITSQQPKQSAQQPGVVDSPAPAAAESVVAADLTTQQAEVPPGYNAAVETLRNEEFTRLAGRVYADYAGAAPYSERLLAEVMQQLSGSLHGNPHSEVGWAPESRGAAAEAARQATLRMCCADPEQYHCIFTSGATAAFKLVGESFPWGPASTFLYLRDNHNSVLGMRQLAAQHGAACTAAVELGQAGDSSVSISGNSSSGSGSSSGGSGHACGKWQLVACGEAGASALALAHAAAATAAATSAAAAAQGSQAGQAADEEPAQPTHLFAFPAESNLTGVSYDPSLVKAVQRGEAAGVPPGRCLVLLDAAKACGTSPPNLAAAPADFVALSFYKIFGYPTGLGALLVRKDALPCLRRRYFGGGTVEVSVADEPFHSLRQGPAGWEDGTQSFLDFPAVLSGLAFIQRLGGFPAIAAHADAVAASLARQLSSLRHLNGAPVCVLYGGFAQLGHQQEQEEQQQTQHQEQQEQAQQQQGHQQGQRQQQQAQWQVASCGVVGQGPVVAFNLLRSDGSPVGYREVEKLASLSGIMLRTGCCCNPGACGAALGLTGADMRANHAAGHVCWDGQDVINGCPTGLVRASFGYASSLSDADAIAKLVAQYWQEGATPAALAAEGGSSTVAASAVPPMEVVKAVAAATLSLLPAPITAAATTPPVAAAVAGDGEAVSGAIDSLWVYPLKSCRGFSPLTWPLGPSGLLFDRCWVLVDSSGAALRLKQHPELATIQPSIDLHRRCLVVTALGAKAPLEVPLPSASGSRASQQQPEQQQVVVQEQQQQGHDEGQASTSAQAKHGTRSIRVCSRSECAERAAGAAGGEEEAAAWFSDVLGLPCRLMQLAEGAKPQPQPPAAATSATQAAATSVPSTSASAPAAAAAATAGAEGGARSPPPRSFANESHLLVLCAASLADLRQRAGSEEAPATFAQRFRPNLIVGGAEAYAEDRWTAVSLQASYGNGSASSAQDSSGSSGNDNGAMVVLESAGLCTRCDMVCADPLTGRRTGPEPLLTLAGYRRNRGRISFGRLMNQQQLGQQPQQPQQQQQQSEASGEGWLPATLPWLAVGGRVRPTL